MSLILTKKQMIELNKILEVMSYTDVEFATSGIFVIDDVNHSQFVWNSFEETWKLMDYQSI